MRSTAQIGAGDRPAPDIVAPLVGGKAALDQMAEDALRDPDSSACAYVWVPATLTTIAAYEFPEGAALRVLYEEEMRPAVVYGAVSISQSDPLVTRQSVPIRILLQDSE